MRRHLSQKHKELSKEGQEKAITLHASLIKSKEERGEIPIKISDGKIEVDDAPSSSKKTQIRIQRICPICHVAKKYLYDHMPRVHNIPVNSQEYKDMLKNVSNN